MSRAESISRQGRARIKSRAEALIAPYSIEFRLWDTWDCHEGLEIATTMEEVYRTKEELADALVRLWRMEEQGTVSDVRVKRGLNFLPTIRLRTGEKDHG